MNIESYNNSEIVSYYCNFIKYGLFSYEERLIKKFFLNSGKTLDIGCGVGRTTIPLYKMGYDVIGIDYSCNMIQAAKKNNNNITYLVENILNTSFDNMTFDNILFSFNGLMLLDSYNDRQNALKEIKRILKPNGYFIFTTPFLDNKIETEYWKNKINDLGICLENISWEQQLILGDEVLEDCNNIFKIHIPFISEVKKLISDVGLDLVFSKRRLDYSGIEKSEKELDDNYLWVVKNECN